MSTISSFWKDRPKAWALIAGGFGVVAFWAVLVLSGHGRLAPESPLPQAFHSDASPSVPMTSFYSGKTASLKAAALRDVRASTPVSPSAGADAAGSRKIVRTSSLEMVVQHPAEAAEKIRMVAENLGGFLESSQVSGGQDSVGGR
jgi:hypothetical protein